MFEKYFSNKQSFVAINSGTPLIRKISYLDKVATAVLPFPKSKGMGKELNIYLFEGECY